MSEPSDASANRLADETSAYLRQHMRNPVDWYPWGDEALALARSEDKPLLVSIGYSACHWCHVMERESFEDAETAQLMNDLFVPIKVDREERPDIDQLYMDTVVRLTGHGGWPLTVFCLPDGRPFYGGTYYPPEPRHGMPSFREVLQAVGDAYRDRRGEVEDTAAQILGALEQRPDGAAQEAPGAKQVALGAQEIMRGADPEHGGFGSGPKFPTPTNLELLLTALDFITPESARPILTHCVLTGQEMARRGLYDHVGGGFHRYCVDRHWGIPHFEKMLYDQGLLLRVYAELWRRSQGSVEFEWPIRETAAYLRREMLAPEGGYYASQDADAEGEEGRFHVWTPAQVDELLGERAAAFREAYGVTDAGNFEGGTTHLADRARRPRAEFAEERATLYAARAARVPPATDHKRVAAWNAYVISGLARCGSLLDDEQMLDDARAAADFLLRRMQRKDGSLMRVFDGEVARVPAFLDDHAALLDAFLDLHRAGGGDAYLQRALHLAERIAAEFYDSGERDLYLTPASGEPLVHRPRSDHDGATPHAAGLATLGLLRVASLSGRNDLRDVAESVIHTHAYVLERTPHAHPTLLRAVAFASRGASVAVVVGHPVAPATRALAQRARLRLLPEDGVIVWSPESSVPEGLDPSWVAGRRLHDGRPSVYVCHGTTCSLPVTDPEKLDDLESLMREALEAARA